jgi:hypothetical protein
MPSLGKMYGQKTDRWLAFPRVGLPSKARSANLPELPNIPTQSAALWLVHLFF